MNMWANLYLRKSEGIDDLLANETECKESESEIERINRVNEPEN